jgi:DNA-binding CsgD family transcriptional regulator
MPQKQETCGYHFVGSPRQNLVEQGVRPLAVSYFFVVATLAFLAVWLAHRLQVRFRQPYLPAFMLYVGFWCGLTLLSIMLFVLGGLFLPGTSVDAAVVTGGPLFATLLAVALYFLSQFMAQLSGRDLPRRYTAGYVAVCSLLAIVMIVGSQQASDATSGWRMASSAMMFLIKMLTVCGWSAYAWVRIGTLGDSLERRGRRGVVLSFLAGFVVFEGALRDVAAVVGFHSTDYVIGFLQAASVYPPLVYLESFLRRRSVSRPLEPPSAGQIEALAKSGVSPREAEVIELILTGLSHKEVAERLSISPETVKKHTYNAYRKLGVQNRVQLSYVVQHRAGPGPAV